MAGVVNLTIGELKERLLGRKGATAASIVARTVPRMNKKGNPFYGSTFKLSRVSIMVGWIYENSVNRARDKEGHPEYFTPEPRKWGTRVVGTPLVLNEKTGEYYLEAKVQKALETQYEDASGKIINYEDLKPYLVTRDTESSRQELSKENEIILRDYSLSSLIEMRLDGEILLIKS